MKARNCRWSRDSPGALPATNEIEGLFDEPGAAFDFHLLSIGSFQAKGHAKVRFDRAFAVTRKQETFDEAEAGSLLAALMAHGSHSV